MQLLYLHSTTLTEGIGPFRHKRGANALITVSSKLTLFSPLVLQRGARKKDAARVFMVHTQETAQAKCLWTSAHQHAEYIDLPL